MSIKMKQILIVEDEKIVALDIKGMLSRLGFDVLDIVSTGDKAIEMVANKKPDLILMDIMLKGEMDGINAAQQIIKHYNTPIIFLTAHSDQKNKTESQYCQSTRIFAKTVSRKTIKLYNKDRIENIIISV